MQPLLYLVVKEHIQSAICKTLILKITLKSTSVSVCFRGISRLPSAFVFLRWFKLAHISIHICTFHDGCKQGINQQILIGNRFHVKLRILSPWMRNFTWNRFPIKNLLIDSLLTPIVKSTSLKLVILHIQQNCNTSKLMHRHMLMTYSSQLGSLYSEKWLDIQGFTISKLNTLSRISQSCELFIKSTSLMLTLGFYSFSH